MNMSLERTYSCESTDTASEMLYDSFDHDLTDIDDHVLSDIDDNVFTDIDDSCFFDDVTDDTLTADQVQSFEYIFWLKKLSGVLGINIERPLEHELKILQTTMDRIKYLSCCLDIDNEIGFRQSLYDFTCFQSNVSSPRYDIYNTIDLNSTFRRKLSFEEIHQTCSRFDYDNSCSTKSNILDPYSVLNKETWRFDEESQDTIIAGPTSSINYLVNENETDMSTADDSLYVPYSESYDQDLNCSMTSNTSFMSQNTPIINSEIYSSLQQMCLSQSDVNNDSAFELESDAPTEEEIFEYYLRQFPTLSSLLIQDSSSDSSWEGSVSRRRTKRKKLKPKRKIVKKKKKTRTPMKCTKERVNTQVVEADSTTISPESHPSVNSVEPARKPKSKRSIGLKRPKNGFIRFSIEYRKVLAEKHPNVDNRDVSKMLGQKWRKMSAEERKPYEEEFAHDLEEIKKQNPSWKYSTNNRMSADEIEPLPSRLRPRDKLKRKFSPYLIKTSSAKKRRTSPRVKHKSSRKSAAIVRCSICSRYQQIYGVPEKNLSDIRMNWFCGLNPDPDNNRCFARLPIHQQASMKTFPEAATITTSGPFTSVVSRTCPHAKADGKSTKFNRDKMYARKKNTTKRVHKSTLYPMLRSELESNTIIRQRIAPLSKSSTASSTFPMPKSLLAGTSSMPVNITVDRKPFLTINDLVICSQPSDLYGQPSVASPLLPLVPTFSTADPMLSSVANLPVAMPSVAQNTTTSTVSPLVAQSTVTSTVIPSSAQTSAGSHVSTGPQGLQNTYQAVISFLPLTTQSLSGSTSSTVLTITAQTPQTTQSPSIPATTTSTSTTAATLPYLAVFPKHCGFPCRIKNCEQKNYLFLNFRLEN